MSEEQTKYLTPKLTDLSNHFVGFGYIPVPCLEKAFQSFFWMSLMHILEIIRQSQFIREEVVYNYPTQVSFSLLLLLKFKLKFFSRRKLHSFYTQKSNPSNTFTNPKLQLLHPETNQSPLVQSNNNLIFFS